MQHGLPGPDAWPGICRGFVRAGLLVWCWHPGCGRGALLAELRRRGLLPNRELTPEERARPAKERGRRHWAQAERSWRRPVPADGIGDLLRMVFQQEAEAFMAELGITRNDPELSEITEDELRRICWIPHFCRHDG